MSDWHAMWFGVATAGMGLVYLGIALVRWAR